MLVFALIAIWLSGVGTIGAGAILFATGFMLLGGIAMLNVWRSHRPTVF
ncbi:MAG TPA: hypothetical protein VIV40_26790 [Kofleriaceae bacterium]